MRLVAEVQLFQRVGEKRKAHVVVEMGGLCAARRYRVNVDVVDGFLGEDDARKAGLFGRLAQRNAANVGIAVGVAAQLDPNPELAVVRQQRVAQRAIDDPGRTGHVAARETPFEAARLGAHEAQEFFGHCGLACVASVVLGKFGDQAFPARGIGAGRSKFHRMKSNRRLVLAVLVAALAVPASALAATTTAPQNLTLQAAMRPHNSQSVPYSGILKIKIEPDGIVNGTYVSNSIRPDPSNGKIVPVTGGLTGTNIHLSFGTGGTMRVTGTFHNGHIVGTAYRKGQIFDFEAIVK